MFRISKVVGAAAIALAWLATPVLASATIDMSKILVDERGQPIVDQLMQSKDDPQCEHCGSLTLGMAAAHSLLAQFPDERELDPLQKWARGALAMRLKDGGQVAMSAEEIAVVKRLIGKLYGGVVIMQVYPLLDPGVTAPSVK